MLPTGNNPARVQLPKEGTMVKRWEVNIAVKRTVESDNAYMAMVEAIEAGLENLLGAGNYELCDVQIRPLAGGQDDDDQADDDDETDDDTDTDDTDTDQQVPDADDDADDDIADKCAHGIDIDEPCEECERAEEEWQRQQEERDRQFADEDADDGDEDAETDDGETDDGADIGESIPDEDATEQADNADQQDLTGDNGKIQIAKRIR